MIHRDDEGTFVFEDTAFKITIILTYLFGLLTAVAIC